MGPWEADSGAQPILSAMARTAAVASQTDRRHVVGRLRGLSVILPCHDEAQNVERAIDEATAAGELVADAHEILVVDDGSTRRHPRAGSGPRRGRPARARARARRQPRLRRRGPHGDRRGALGVGLPHRRRPAIRRAELARFVPLAQSSDIVAGFRTHRADPPHRLLNAAAWNILVRRLFDVPLRDVDCAFKLMRRDLVQALPLAAEGAMVSTELVTRAHEAGARIAELGVGHAPGWPGGRRARARGSCCGPSASCVPCARSCAKAAGRRARRPVAAGAGRAPADLSRPRAAYRAPRLARPRARGRGPGAGRACCG